MLPSTPGTLPHRQGGCVSSLLPMELHGGKKLLIDFPFWGMVPLQWVLEPGQQCIQPQLWDVDSMPRQAVQLTISTSRQLPLPRSPAPGSFDKTDKKECTSEGKRMNNGGPGSEPGRAVSVGMEGLYQGKQSQTTAHLQPAPEAPWMFSGCTPWPLSQCPSMTPLPLAAEPHPSHRSGKPALGAETLLEPQFPAISSEWEVQESWLVILFLVIVIKASFNLFFKTILQFVQKNSALCKRYNNL